MGLAMVVSVLSRNGGRRTSASSDFEFYSEYPIGQEIDLATPMSDPCQHPYWTDFTNELAALSSYLGGLPRSTPGKAKVSLILGPQHADQVRAARDEASKRIFVTSHRLSNAAHTTVLAPVVAAAKDRDVATEIYYGIKSGPLSGAGLSDIIIEGHKHSVKITPVHEPRLHAKLLAWDDDAAVISSQNWLSTDPPDDKPRSELGLSIRSPGIARQIIDRFNAIRR